MDVLYTVESHGRTYRDAAQSFAWEGLNPQRRIIDQWDEQTRTFKLKDGLRTYQVVGIDATDRHPDMYGIVVVDEEGKE